MGTQDGPTVSRRMFGSVKAAPPPDVRPPWTDDAALAAACTKCGACVSACPERIIVMDVQGLPRVDFHHGACTFCGACADACPAPVFDRQRPAPWRSRARMTTSCLPAHGIVCQSCRDACPEGAIQFPMRRGGVPLPGVIASRCTGCGACVSVCPADAVELREPAT